VKLIPVFLITILLSGCGLFKFHETPVITTKPVDINKSALEYCLPLNEAPAIVSYRDILVAYSDITIAYANCAGKQATSVKLLKEFGNIK
jgi:hypothetical protein